MMHKIKTTKIGFLKSDNLKETWYAIVYTSNILLVIAINCLAQCSSYLLFTICPTIRHNIWAKSYPGIRCGVDQAVLKSKNQGGLPLGRVDLVLKFKDKFC